MDSHPGDLPQEPREQSTKLPGYNHLLNKGSFLLTGTGGGGEVIRSEFRSRD